MIHRHVFALGALMAAMVSMACATLLPGEPAKAEGTTPVSQAPAAAPGKPLLGFSTFPYDISPASYERMFQLGKENGQVYVVQRDNGIPWKEALNDEPMPASVLKEWADFKKHQPAGVPFYLAIAPLEFDRVTLAGACPGSSIPKEIKGAAFDSKAVKAAYLNYCRAAVKYFKPDFLNIGVEAGEMAHRKPSTWPAFARLIEHVRSNLKQEFPDLKIGISFGLQSLMEPKAAALAKDLVESCDYLGLSFYPYMGDFHEKFGAPRLPGPPDEWRVPLEWARSYTTRPIAICETGYNTVDVALSKERINLKGSQDWQKMYVEDLARISARDGYLFVIWYFPVDIDRFLDTLPDNGGAIVMWERNGLLDKDLNPKPAFAAWKSALAGIPAEESGNATKSPTPTVPPGPVVASFDFKTDKELFLAPAGAKVTRNGVGGPDGKLSMEWQYSYGKDWAWASKKVSAGALKGSTNLSFWVNATSEGPVVVQFKESSGEAFSFVISPTKDWALVTTDFASMSCNADTRKDGVLDPSKVVEVILADGGGTQGKKGDRRVAFSRWEFR